MGNMASKSDPKHAAASKNKGIPQEQIIAGFQELRNQQRAIVNKISELEMERKEHDLVIETLKDIEPERRCFRMVGGVLVERTAKEVLPALQNNYESIGKVLETLSSQLHSKGQEINEYKEKYNLRIRGEDEAASNRQDQEASKGSSGVLVAQQGSS